MSDRWSDASLIGNTCVGERPYCTPPALHTANYLMNMALFHLTKKLPFTLNMLNTMAVFKLYYHVGHTTSKT